MALAVFVIVAVVITAASRFSKKVFLITTENKAKLIVCKNNNDYKFYLATSDAECLINKTSSMSLMPWMKYDKIICSLENGYSVRGEKTKEEDFPICSLKQLQNWEANRQTIQLERGPMRRLCRIRMIHFHA